MGEPRKTAGRARQQAQAATREGVLAAAAALFANYGSNNTTMAMVAREAKVAVGTVYLHFPDKDTLLAEVLAAALSALKASLAEAASARSARTAAEDVGQRTSGLVNFAAARPDLAAVLFNPAHLAEPAGADTLAFLVASQAAALAAARERGWARADLDDQTAARALVGSLVAVVGWWLGCRAAGRPAPAPGELAGQLAGLRLYGTAPRPRE